MPATVSLDNAFKNGRMEHFIPKQYDQTIGLVDDSKECRRLALLGRNVKIKTLHNADPFFVEETCFNNIEAVNIPWQGKDRISVICRNNNGKSLLLFIDELEMRDVAAESAINAKQLVTILGYETSFTSKVAPKTRKHKAVSCPDPTRNIFL